MYAVFLLDYNFYVHECAFCSSIDKMKYHQPHYEVNIISVFSIHSFKYIVCVEFNHNILMEKTTQQLGKNVTSNIWKIQIFKNKNLFNFFNN